MTSCFRSSDGYALATAVIIMSIMLTIGLSAFAFVDTETDASRRERTHETRLNLTEGVMAAQIFQMSRSWPATVDAGFPAACTEASSEALCPQPTQVQSNFSGSDFTLDPGWTVQVRDDDIASSTGQYYDDDAVLVRPTWDQNDNGEMWVRAEGRLEGKPRIVVARVRVEMKPIVFPDGPFVAGSFATGNNGNKTIVSTGGKNGVVRCDDGGAPPSSGNPCIGYRVGQVQPVGTVISAPETPQALIPPGVLDSLRAMAKSKGTYYENGCPANPSGEVVFVENGNCHYNSNLVVNSAADPGMFVINNGTMLINGTVTWHGVIYAVNAQQSSGTVLEASGNADIRGGMFIDGAGRLSVGNSKNNLTYVSMATQGQTAYGTAGIIQNTWREVAAG